MSGNPIKSLLTKPTYNASFVRVKSQWDIKRLPVNQLTEVSRFLSGILPVVEIVANIFFVLEIILRLFAELERPKNVLCASFAFDLLSVLPFFADLLLPEANAENYIIKARLSMQYWTTGIHLYIHIYIYIQRLSP